MGLWTTVRAPGALFLGDPDNLLRPLDGRSADDARLPREAGAALGAGAVMAAWQKQDLVVIPPGSERRRKRQ